MDFQRPLEGADDDEALGTRNEGCARPQPHHILLVDDDHHILKSLRIYLEMEDFRVTTASCGRDALDRVAHDPPQLVVLDVMMPEMDGFQVLERLKGNERTRAIPVVMMTAKGQDADVMRGYQAGAAFYMTKPVNYDQLVDNIHLIFQNEEIAARKGKT